MQSNDSQLTIPERYKLSEMPNCINVKALFQHGCHYRLRMGHFRVFLNFDGVDHIVTLEELKKRLD